MKIIYKSILLCTFSVLIFSCSESKNLNASGNSINNIKKDHYGIWNLDNCALKARRADTSIKMTDFYTKEDMVRVVMKFDQNLEEKPSFRIYGLEDYDIELNGSQDTYTFEVSADLIDKARMVLDDTFIEVSYRLEGMDYYRRAIYSMRNVPQAMLDIEKVCKN